eukprot:TRINITY_DN282_c0_g1_i7.p1 TRINITY_DN282_c0_g1~~TRINITY_DN282_c0_g1_i7.p1  ORF type:complete len:1106 (-),score=182.29 TRINITY_DN282_c0_g1_i7:180-3497(-)
MAAEEQTNVLEEEAAEGGEEFYNEEEGGEEYAEEGEVAADGEEGFAEDGEPVDEGAQAGNAEINTSSFEDLVLDSEWVADSQSAWKTLAASASSKEACADAIYAALYEASPAMQYLFTSPRAIAAGRFMAGIHKFINGLSDPPQLKNEVETLAFGHLALDVTIPRVIIFRDALLDLFQVELGNKLTLPGYKGIRALLNYVGGAIIYIKVFYNARILLIGESWALSNDTESNKDKFATMGSIEVAKGEAHAEVDEIAKGEAMGEKSDAKGGKGSVSGQNVPTTFKEMFTFNAAVMGFGANLWMNEVLECFENVVLNVANPNRLGEECDFILCRISKVSTGAVNLAEFKSGMLASLRSLLPKDWTTQHEVAWSWLWDLVERQVKANMGMPAKWERAYATFLDGIDEATGFNLRRDIYLTFFALAPAGQDYFKQSNTYLHLVSTKVLTMALDLYRDPVRMVDDISGVGLRHVGYGISTEFFGPFASSAVQVIAGLTSDQTCVDGFNWSMGLMTKCTMRTIIEGSTIVMKAINTNTRKAMATALGTASRGERAKWMLLVQVGSQNISPLAWSVQSGALECSSAMITDLMTFRADRDRYYYACDDLFIRHPDVVNMLLQEAPALLPELLDGCIWRSRMTFNGMRRVNYYCKHLIVNPEGKYALTLDWVIKEKDPKLVCHPVLALQSDLLWDRVARRVFLQSKSWSVLNLAIFIISQAVLSRQESTEAMRIVIAICRIFIYCLSLGTILFSQSRQTTRAIRLKDFMNLSKYVKIPKYFETWQEVASFALMLLLVAMLVSEPILFCLDYDNGDLLTDLCTEGSKIKLLNSQFSMFAAFLYWLLVVDLVVLNNRVSAYVLVCARMVAEVGLFLLALVMILLAFSSGLSCLDQQLGEFQGIHNGLLALWEIFFLLFSSEAYLQLQDEPVVMICVFVFLIIAVLFLSNLLVAQLTCTYGTVYADMVGYARIQRIRVIVDSMPQVTRKQWDNFVESLGFEKKIEFNEGDVGVNNGIAMTEKANLHPTTVDVIKRFGGSTSPDMQWPAEDNGNEEGDRFERLETLIKRAMERVTQTGGKRGGAGQSSANGGGSSTGQVGQSGAGESAGGEEEAEVEE